MTFRNSTAEYGDVAKLFHWGIAALFLSAFLVVYIGSILFEHDTSPSDFAVQYHVSAGVIVFFLALARILWRFFDAIPKPLSGNRLEVLAARSTQFSLYFFTLLMPLTGWIGYKPQAFTLFWNFRLPTFRAFGEDWVVRTFDISWESFDAGIDLIHKEFGFWVVGLLMFAHIVGALYHHFGRKDETLRRMLWSKGKSAQTR